MSKAQTVHGTGDLPAPMSVVRFYVEADPLGDEADWLKLGRPLWTIVYHVANGSGAPQYAYARTFAPTCNPLSACLTCPSNTKAIYAGVSINGKDVTVPVRYTMLASEDEGVAMRRRNGGVVGRWHFWDYGGDMPSHQRYAHAETGEQQTAPQYREGDGPPPKVKRTRKKGTPAPRPETLDIPIPPDPLLTAADDGMLTAANPNPSETGPCPITETPTTTPPSNDLPHSNGG
jgi:hypothetical protein